MKGPRLPSRTLTARHPEGTWWVSSTRVTTEPSWGCRADPAPATPQPRFAKTTNLRPRGDDGPALPRRIRPRSQRLRSSNEQAAASTSPPPKSGRSDRASARGAAETPLDEHESGPSEAGFVPRSRRKAPDAEEAQPPGGGFPKESLGMGREPSPLAVFNAAAPLAPCSRRARPQGDPTETRNKRRRRL